MWGFERWIDHCDICYLACIISHLGKTAVPIFFPHLVNHLKFSIMQANCVLHEWFISPDVLLNLQLHLHLRHVTLTDAHKDNAKSLRKCCIMSGTVHWRNKDM